MAKEKVDWESIELEYAKGTTSNVKIAAMFGVSEAAIRKKIKQYAWTKDLRGKIKVAADRKVRESLVREKSARNKINEAKQVDIAAETQSIVIISHRKDIGRSRNLGTKLLFELEAQTENPELFEQLGELMKSPDENFDKLNEAYKKVISTTGRIDNYKKLMESLRYVITLERQSHGIVDDEKPPQPLDEISRETLKLVRDKLAFG
jgi:transposase